MSRLDHDQRILHGLESNLGLIGTYRINKDKQVQKCISSVAK